MEPVITLSENDIPGASLCGRKPAVLKTEELRFWLKCRGDPAKGLKTKAQLVKRVQEYVDTGRDKTVVDPDQNGIYSRRKRRQQESSQEKHADTSASVAYPSNGWSTDLKRMPLFTRAEMNLHISQSEKNFDPNNKHHSVPTCMRKAKTFLDDEYFKEILAASDKNNFYFKCLCYHSFRKSEPPHKLQVALCLLTGSVVDASCSCVAGNVGFCNHVLGLMINLCKLSLYDCKDIKELNNEDDMTPSVACTSTLQLWHKTGRGDKIKAEPVMEVVAKKTKLDTRETADSSGIKCLLYEARKSTKSQTNDEILLKATLQKINPSIGLCQVMSPGNNDLVDTKFGKSPSGSYSSYQLQFTEANFSVNCNLASVPRKENNADIMLMAYPAFPLQKTNQYQKPDNLHVNEDQDALLDHVIVDEVKLNRIEKNTREQSCSNHWKNERKYRLTASNFKTITKRQRNHDTLTNNLLNPKSFSSKYTEHGKQHEPIALQQYEKYMFSTRNRVRVLKSGLVVNIELPFIGATPDGKVIDVGCMEPFGLVEVKCPLTKFMVTPLEACSHTKFCAEEKDGKPTLKKDHMYFFQVQGQLAVTKAIWCDFVIYTRMGMSIEKITFDAQFWNSVEDKLKSFFFDHFFNTAAVEFATRLAI